MDAEELEALVESGYAALDDGDLEAAAAVAAQLLAAAPHEPDGYALQSEVLLSREDVDEALEVLERGLAACRGASLLLGARARVLLDVFDDPLGARQDLEAALAGHPDQALAADLQIMLAEACLELQDPAAALRAAEVVAGIYPEAADAELIAAQALFDLHRFDDALRACARSIDREPRLAAAYFTRGEILAALGDDADAARAFKRARKLDPESYPREPKIDATAFERIVAEAIDELPPAVAEYLHNVAVVVEERPDLDALRESDPPLSPACYGLFEGTPRPRESTADPWSTLPKAVRLYRQNILRRCASEEEAREVVSTTLLHEIGHFLGLEEDDLIERGLR